MKKIYINMNAIEWLDEYDFVRDVVGIVREEIQGNLLIVYVNKADYENVMEEGE